MNKYIKFSFSFFVILFLVYKFRPVEDIHNLNQDEESIVTKTQQGKKLILPKGVNPIRLGSVKKRKTMRRNKRRKNPYSSYLQGAWNIPMVRSIMEPRNDLFALAEEYRNDVDNFFTKGQKLLSKTWKCIKTKHCKSGVIPGTNFYSPNNTDHHKLLNRALEAVKLALNFGASPSNLDKRVLHELLSVPNALTQTLALEILIEHGNAEDQKKILGDPVRFEDEMAGRYTTLVKGIPGYEKSVIKAIQGGSNSSRSHIAKAILDINTTPKVTQSFVQSFCAHIPKNSHKERIIRDRNTLSKKLLATGRSLADYCGE